MDKLETKKLEDLSTASEAQDETLTQTVVGMLIAFLERIFFEKGNSSSTSSSSHTQKKSNLPSSDELQNNFYQVFLNLIKMPFTIPYIIILYFIKLPVRLADLVIQFALKKLKMTKGEAQVYAKKVAKKQVYFIRNFCLIMTLTVAVFSVSLGVSSTLYTGVYIYLIPSQTQDLQMYFNYVPVEQEQQNQLSSEA